MWYLSIFLFIITLVPFIFFMEHPSVSNLRYLLLMIAVSTAMYVVSVKHITHPKGYTAVQAISFYKACKKEELNKPEQCKKRTVKFKEIASRYEYSKDMELDDLLEFYQMGYNIFNGKDA